MHVVIHPVTAPAPVVAVVVAACAQRPARSYLSLSRCALRNVIEASARGADGRLRVCSLITCSVKTLNSDKMAAEPKTIAPFRRRVKAAPARRAPCRGPAVRSEGNIGQAAAASTRRL
ncbi:hypothetical protein EVAR_44722_1 [Eumeta japonica]|uniref:Uncharacterized protein n=1 Tax=Eumeta variegata TaxID=151549 RepID=A0A4C1XG54_EUMVA|nr:hypothetical protein EVAR_44722_1 [Eumeta japonica]